MDIYSSEIAQVIVKSRYQDLLDEAHRSRLVRLVSGPRVGLLGRMQRFLSGVTEYAQLQPALARAECALNPVQC